MHNGDIAHFSTMKRRLQADLPDVAFNMVQGNTGELFISYYFLVFNSYYSLRLGMGICIVPVKGTTFFSHQPIGRRFAHLNFSASKLQCTVFYIGNLEDGHVGYNCIIE